MRSERRAKENYMLFHCRPNITRYAKRQFALLLYGYAHLDPIYLINETSHTRIQDMLFLQ